MGALSAAFGLVFLVAGDPSFLAAAEAELLRGDPRTALDTLTRLASESEESEEDRARALRLEVDARLASGDTVALERAIAELAARPGWEAHAARQSAALSASRFREQISKFGLAMFAFAMAIVALGGARELLRPGRETLVLAGVAAFVIAVARMLTPSLLPGLGLLAVASTTLGHAAATAARRTEPSPKGRLLLVLTFLLGILGASLALVARPEALGGFLEVDAGT